MGKTIGQYAQPHSLSESKTRKKLCNTNIIFNYYQFLPLLLSLCCGFDSRRGGQEIALGLNPGAFLYS